VHSFLFQKPQTQHCIIVCAEAVEWLRMIEQDKNRLVSRGSNLRNNKALIFSTIRIDRFRFWEQRISFSEYFSLVLDDAEAATFLESLNLRVIIIMT